MAERFIPKEQEIYRHFKGNLYQVKALAEHTETGEQLVIYQAMDGDCKIYARPLDMFVEAVDREKYPEADQEFRFQLQGPEAGRQSGATQPGLGVQLKKEAAETQIVSETYAAGAGEQNSSEPEEPGIDPLVLEFLDARTYEQRLNVLAALHHRITNEMITTMSLCCDIEVEGDDVEQRYEELKQCLIMKDRFEIKRLG